MAGQSPDPSFQPAEQDSGLTQGRPAWQVPPGYTPPGGSATGGGAVGAQAYAASPPSYVPADQAYPGQDQTYTAQGQDYQGQDYQGGYQQGYPGYGAQQAQGATAPPQWQGPTGTRQVGGRAKAQGEKGFVGSLLDFSFQSFVTPKIVKVLYVLVTIWTAILGLTMLIIGFKLGGTSGGLFTLIIVEPIFILLTLGIYRVVLEAFMVVFRIYEETKKIRENSESQG
jgi:hypothetical protein